MAHQAINQSINESLKLVDLGVRELAEPEHGAAGLDGLDYLLAGVAGQRKPDQRHQLSTHNRGHTN